jgi:site-specific recombinase XerC
MQAAPTEDVERLFYSSIASSYTQRSYRTYLNKYLAFYGMKNISELLTKDHKEIEHQIINFIIQSKEKGMKRGAISNYITPVLAFVKLNDIMVNTTKINKFMPPQVKSKKTFGYDHSHIGQLMSIADERMKCVILLCSHGLRIGAIPGLNVSSLEEYKDLYKITVYEGLAEEFIVFSTTELKKVIDSYLSMRSDVYGEVITKQSPVPLIREQFDRRDQFAIAHPKRVKESALARKLTELAEAAGLRTKVQLKEGQQAASIRADIPRTNGFRRFYCGILADSGLLTERRWLLEGHALKGNDSAYLKITTEDLYNQFMLAHDNLLIDQSHKLKREIEVLTIEKSKVDLALAQIEDMKKRIGLI